MPDSVFVLMRRSSLAWGLTLAFGLGLLFGLLGGFTASPASQAFLVLVAFLGGLLLLVGGARAVPMQRRFGLGLLVELALLLLVLLPILLVQVFPQTLVSCLVVGWIAALALGGPGQQWKALRRSAFLGCVTGLGMLGAYWSFNSWQAVNILLAGTMLLLAVLGGVLGGSARGLAAWWLGTATPHVASSPLIPHDEAVAPVAASQGGHLSRRSVLAGIGGAIGLAAAGGGLTWATRSLTSYFVLPLLTYRGHQELIWSVSWSPDGTRIVSVGHEFTDSYQVWEAATGKTLFVAPKQPQGKTFFATWSPNGRWIAVDYTFGVGLWDAASGAVLAAYQNVVGASGWSPDSTRLVSKIDGVIWDAATGHSLVTWRQSDFISQCAVWSPDGARIASGGAQIDVVHPERPPQNQVVIWEAATGQSLLVYRGHAQDQPYLFVNQVAWSPDGTQIASASEASGVVQVWKAATGQTVLLYRGHTAQLTALAWSPDGKRIASASLDGTVQVWNPRSGECLFTYHGHNTAGSQGGGAVSTMAWSPDGRVIASGDNHATIQIWRPT